jgi:hypothetical protein
MHNYLMIAATAALATQAHAKTDINGIGLRMSQTDAMAVMNGGLCEKLLTKPTDARGHTAWAQTYGGDPDVICITKYQPNYLRNLDDSDQIRVWYAPELPEHNVFVLSHGFENNNPDIAQEVSRAYGATLEPSKVGGVTTADLGDGVTLELRSAADNVWIVWLIDMREVENQKRAHTNPAPK